MRFPRPCLRIVFPILAGLFTVLFGTIFRQNVETWAAARGYDRLISEGLGVIEQSVWFPITVVGFLLSIGATIGLWCDYWLRNFNESRRERRPDPIAELFLRIPGEHFGVVESIRDVNIHAWRFIGSSSLHLILVFDTPIIDGHIIVFSTNRGLKWTEDQLTDRMLAISLTGETKLCTAFISVKAASISNSRRQQPNIEQNAGYISVDEARGFYPEIPKERMY